MNAVADVWVALGALALIAVALLIGRAVRSRRRSRSIRAQVSWAIASTTLIATATFALGVASRFEARVVAFSHRAAMDDAFVVASLVERGMEVLGLDFHAGSRLLRRDRVLVGFTERSNDTLVELIDADGRILFDTRSVDGVPSPALRAPEVYAALEGRVDPEIRFSSPGVVVVAVPVRRDGVVVGVVRVHKPTDSMTRVAADVGVVIALLALGLALLAALSGLFIARGVAAPIERLTQAARAIASGERQAALPEPEGAREVRELTEAFEEMRSELEQRAAIEALAADLSHELKSPIAAIVAASEVLEDAIREDPDAALRFNVHIGEAARKLGALTEDLLSLSRLEASGIRVEEMDLSLVVGAVVADVERTAAHADVDVEVDAPAALRRRGDPTWIARAVQNLVENAVSFSPAGAMVRVEVRRDEQHDTVAVTDAGPGVDESIREQVFERFRTTRGGSGGTGLGLAIVRSVAESHGGEAVLARTGAGGSTFELRLPR